jgi:subtilisin family serine protease
LNVMTAPSRPGEQQRSLVVNNSWGMFHPTWDFPVGHPGNYSDNANHPFNRIVASLERTGADILFAAGNCGRDCPDGRCQGVTDRPIYGANSHSQVLSVAGVDVKQQRVGYSSIGPGRLERLKPDVAGYTHFKGSEVYPADGGTSAATPVVAGVVAAVRTARPFTPGRASTYPSAIRLLLRRTAIDRGQAGYDFEFGYGIVDGEAVARRARLLINAPEDASAGAAAEPAGKEPDAELVAPQSAAAGPGLGHFFGRTSRDARPGFDSLIITGLPAGTRAISVWMTEWIPPNNPHAGDARFDTISVQLFDDGRQCRVVFRLNWGATLPAGAQVMFGT